MEGQSRKLKILGRLLNLWILAIKTDIYSALGAGCLYKVLPQFQNRGYEVVVCGEKLDNISFSFKPDKKFRYSTHNKFAKLLSEACVYVAMDESYGLTLVEAQMAGTVLVLMKDQYNKQVVLTKLFSEYEGAKFENGRFVNIEESAKSLTRAIETAIHITKEEEYHDQIRNSVFRELDYRKQAKKVADVCLTVGKSRGNYLWE